MSSIQERYDALNLKVLDKVEISQAGWQALEKGTVNQSDPAYKMALPIVVAKFKAAAARQIMGAAHVIPLLGAFQNGSMTMQTAYVPAYIHYKSDVRAIDEALFGKNRNVLMDSRAGKFDRPQASSIHTNGAFGSNERTYLSRLGALPVQYIRRSKLASLPERQREQAENLLRSAMGKDESAQVISAKRELTDMGLLKILPLGEVGLVTAQHDTRSKEEHMQQEENFGRIIPLDPMACLDTLHSSSELPVRSGKPKPTYSAFQRSVFGSRRDFA